MKVGIIGAGNYGTAIVTQAPYTPRLNVVAVADISLAAARGAYEKGGYDMALVVQVETAEEAQARIAEGKSVYTDRPDIIGAIPAVDIAVSIVNRAVTRGVGASRMPGLALRDGVPEELRTLIAMPESPTRTAAVVYVPYLAHDVHDFRALAEVGEILFGGDTEARMVTGSE